DVRPRPGHPEVPRCDPARIGPDLALRHGAGAGVLADKSDAARSRHDGDGIQVTMSPSASGIEETGIPFSSTRPALVTDRIDSSSFASIISQLPSGESARSAG